MKIFLQFGLLHIRCIKKNRAKAMIFDIFASDLKFKKLSSSKRTHFLTSVVSTTTVLYMFSLFGLFIYVGNNLEKHLKENIVLHVYLKSNYSGNELKQFETEYLSKDFIKSFTYKSPETSLREAKESIGEDLVSELDSNPFNSNYEVYLNAGNTAEDRVAKAESSIKASEMVEEISFPKNIADLIEERFAMIAPMLLILCIVLAIVAITLINHNVKLNIFSQRFLIKSMQMVGATKAFIIKPFIKRAIINGVLAGVFSSLLIFNTGYFALYFIPDLRAVLPDFRTDINITLLLILFVVLSLCGVLVSTICTWIATRRYLKSKIDELY